MKLNDADKEVIRIKIKEKLNSIPDDVIIKIDKGLLDQLIFDYKYSEKLGKVVKYIAWSGEYLQKVDLSEISFSNVLWDGRYSNGIDLANTNANINFLTAADCENNSSISLYFCNLENVDLRFSNAQVISTLIDSNLKNTNASLLFNQYIFERTLNVRNTDLENIDLSNVEIDQIILSGESSTALANCNLKNTGINIFFHTTLNNDEKNTLSELIKNEKLSECYINGKLIQSSEEKKKNAQSLLAIYEQKKEALLKETIDSIDKQVRVLKK